MGIKVLPQDKDRGVVAMGDRDLAQGEVLYSTWPQSKKSLSCGTDQASNFINAHLDFDFFKCYFNFVLKKSQKESDTNTNFYTLVGSIPCRVSNNIWQSTRILVCRLLLTIMHRQPVFTSRIIYLHVNITPMSIYPHISSSHIVLTVFGNFGNIIIMAAFPSVTSIT